MRSDSSRKRLLNVGAQVGPRERPRVRFELLRTDEHQERDICPLWRRHAQIIAPLVVEVPEVNDHPLCGASRRPVVNEILRPLPAGASTEQFLHRVIPRVPLL
jgi:hypothetical protein